MKDLTIGELSACSGCHIETIRYYERVKLLPHPARSIGGHRIYSGTDADRLRFILRARALGFSLDNVRKLLRLSDDPKSSCAVVGELASRHLVDVRKKLAGLRAMERVLKKTIAECSGRTRPDCPLIEALGSSDRL